MTSITINITTLSFFVCFNQCTNHVQKRIYCQHNNVVLVGKHGYIDGHIILPDNMETRKRKTKEKSLLHVMM